MLRTSGAFWCLDGVAANAKGDFAVMPGGYCQYHWLLPAESCWCSLLTWATSSLRSATCQGRSWTPPEALTTQLPHGQKSVGTSHSS
ncbi:MAG: hypothetical protein GXP26_11205 [Planctomycetes bacterium]|nr:hypothetical protein [Planctomycetota bacterium]